MVASGRRWSSLICAVVFALFAALPLLPIASGAGWRANHEENIFYVRTLIYAEHLRQGDLLPIWASVDSNDFGSFQPLLYHKLFYLLSGSIYLLIGNIKATLMACLWFWLMVGASGTYSFCRSLKCGIGPSCCGGLMLIFANYTTTNWLTRGAMAEFSSAMILPWVLAAYVQWLAAERKGYRVSVALGVLMSLMFLAHSVLAFYLALLLGAATLLMLLANQLPLRRFTPMPLLAGTASFGLIAGPVILVMYLIVGNDYDISRITLHSYLPEHQLKPMIQYLWDGKYQWGKTWNTYTVQLDLPILVLLFSGLVAGVIAWPARTAHPPYIILALIIVLLLALFLQTEWALPFYRFFPGAAYIQFPWRLLAVITPISIALSLWLWQRMPARLSISLVATTLAISVWLSGVWYPPAYFDRYADDRIPGGVWFGYAGEYVPIKAGPVTYAEGDVVKMLVSKGCRILRLPSPTGDREELERGYTLDCDKPGTYPLPLFGSALHRVGVSMGKDSVWRRCADVISAPALCGVRLDNAGQHHIRVRMPTLSGLVFPPNGTVSPVLGQPIYFNEQSAARYLAVGWSGQEAWGVWSDRAKAAVAFVLPLSLSNETLEMRVGFRPYISPSVGQQRISVSVNGRRVDTWTISRRMDDTKCCKRTIKLGRGLRPAEEVVVGFQIHNPRNPEVDREIADDRHLGLFLQAMTLISSTGEQ